MIKNCDKCGADLPPNHPLKKEKIDVVVTPNTLHLNGIEGLEGDRSKCCYAPANTNTHNGSDEKFHYCSKCDKPCELLTEEEKKNINKKAEGAINDMMAEEVTVTVVYKPTEENISKKVKLPQVRVFAEQAAKTFITGYPGKNAKMTDFLVVEYYHKTGATKVTSLEK